eukprot:TRINITY_DN9343_c0_g1_i2.p1 TRINITY_DN9343_c0_g1~~TRINITY_DN9343_c0_g1_i2.p1  ORF type:complete len:254 (+),score=36.15 TRINITY_DN9343_c0_g1_i2:170-931(+)
MALPENNSDYSSPEYWEERFRTEEEFNWLGGLKHYRHALDNMLEKYEKYDSILQLGCGNSSFSTELSNAGWTNITNLDISLNGLKTLKQREPKSEYLLMDMTRMPLKDASYDIVIEKATLDSLQVTAASPWDLQSQENQLVSKVLSEVKRILRPGGTFVSITFSQPHFRVPLLAAAGLNWAIRVETVPTTGLPSYIMQMTEGDPTPAMNTYSLIHNNNDNSDSERRLSISSDEECFLGNIDPASDSDVDEPSR